AAMRRATLSTRAGDLGAAMRTIQSALRGADAPATPGMTRGEPPPAAPASTLRLVGPTPAAAQPEEPALRVKPRPSFAVGGSRRVRRPMHEVLAAIRRGRVMIDLQA